MSNGIEALTVPALTLALDAAVMRQQVIATNIANAHTAGYVPQRVSFEVEVQRAWQSRTAEGSAPQTASHSLALTAHTAPVPEGPAAVQLDQEVAALAQNSTHYQLLLRGLNRHLSILASAVSEGKR